jgi:anti-sigma factor RsiW
MVRSLLELYTELGTTELTPVLEALGDLLRSASVQVGAFGRLQQRPDQAADREESERAHEAALAARDRAAAALRTMPPATGTGRLLASILVDGERLIREVDIRDGAHTAGVAVT